MKAMQSYRDLIGDTYKGCPAREPVEWSNFWYDGADCRAGRRCLLIGDSTIRMVRSTFAKVAGCPVDMFGTSSALDDELYPKVVSNMVEVKARQGKVIALCNPGREPDADDIWRIPALPAPLAGFLALPALQLFSYEMADYLGKDVDQPRNLAKSVTVE